MNKQDEDKAKELAEECGYSIKDFEFKDVEESCLEMAAWKERKMIDKAIEYLEPIFKDIAGYNCGGELTNDFKKYMEEN